MREWIELLAEVVPAVFALLAYLQGRKNQGKINELHVIINSQFTALLEKTHQRAAAQGRAEGAQQERIRQEQRTRSARAIPRLRRNSRPSATSCSPRRSLR